MTDLTSKEGKCSKHGNTTIIVLKEMRLSEAVEACSECLKEKIEEVNRKKMRYAVRGA